MRVNPTLATEFKELGAAKVTECFNCGNCTAICPVTPQNNGTFPRRLIRYIQLGLEEKVLNAPEVWLCLTCAQCTVTCPREAYPSEIMVAIRKDIIESGMCPVHMRDFLNNLQKQRNPWGIGKFKRDQWRKKADSPPPTVKENPEFEWLWFVDCAHSFDNRNIEVSKKIARLLNDIELNYAILGREEGCCGNDARKAGEEGLFLLLKEENEQIFAKYGVERIVTASPHCYNTFKNEYDGYDVKLLLEIIYDAIKSGALTLKHPVNKKVTYHDSCYLGRYNDIYELPREILKLIPGVELVEMPRNRREALCCGGGAGFVVSEYPGEIRPNNLRAKEAADTGAEVLAVACPFCMIMLEDGVKVQKVDDKIVVRDIIELVYESVYGPEEG
ncbi:MAG: (Fe-S)-binding protein [Archaeoglobus sp.]|nr:(Fe-S)-binding protein [Archaeoglobus sp.]